MNALPGEDAMRALDALVPDPGIAAWHDQLARARDDQRIIHREVGYRHPDPGQLRRVLENAEPAKRRRPGGPRARSAAQNRLDRPLRQQRCVAPVLERGCLRLPHEAQEHLHGALVRRRRYACSQPMDVRPGHPQGIGLVGAVASDRRQRCPRRSRIPGRSSLSRRSHEGTIVVLYCTPWNRCCAERVRDRMSKLRSEATREIGALGRGTGERGWGQLRSAAARCG